MILKGNKILSQIKKDFKDIPFFSNFLRVVFRKRSKRKSSISYWVDRYLPNENFIVIQIGSNDGVTGDPIHRLILQKSKWKVMFVEPVPYLFEELRSNYPVSDRFIFENVAVNNGKEETFYYVDKKANQYLDLPPWYNQLGSFNKAHILKHLDGRLEPYLHQLEIEGINLNNLLSRNKIEYLDFLHIDTEGYDWKILSQLNLDKFKPAIILFEFKHLGDKERRSAISFLTKDYNIYKFGGDFMCIKKEKMNTKDKLILKGKKIELD